MFQKRPRYNTSTLFHPTRVINLSDRPEAWGNTPDGNREQDLEAPIPDHHKPTEPEFRFWDTSFAKPSEGNISVVSGTMSPPFPPPSFDIKPGLYSPDGDIELPLLGGTDPKLGSTEWWHSWGRNWNYISGQRS